MESATELRSSPVRNYEGRGLGSAYSLSLLEARTHSDPKIQIINGIFYALKYDDYVVLSNDDEFRSARWRRVQAHVGLKILCGRGYSMRKAAAALGVIFGGVCGQTVLSQNAEYESDGRVAPEMMVEARQIGAPRSMDSSTVELIKQ